MGDPYYTLSVTDILVNRCEVLTDTNLHTHNFIEIAYVDSGEGTHIVANQSFSVNRGDVFIINYDVPHRFYTDSALTIYNCVFTTEFMDKHLAGSRDFNDILRLYLQDTFQDAPMKQVVHFRLDTENTVPVFRIYQQMLKEFESRRPGYKEIIRAYLLELMTILKRLHSYEDTKSSQALYQAIDYILKHYNEEISLTTLSRIAYMSPSTFARKFKKCTRHTLSAFIQTIRIEQACKQLMTTDHTVSDIAQSVGYSDMKHFYQVFKRITGKSPRDFR